MNGETGLGWRSVGWADLVHSLVFWLAALLLLTWAFVALFHPQFFSFDSYDYMVLSFHPVARGVHPLGFGYFLRGMACLSRALWPGAFAHVFQFWQVTCAAVLVWVVLWARRRGAGPPAPLWVGLQGVLIAALALVTIELLPALVFLMNGYWTEMTSFLSIALAAVLFARAVETGKFQYWLEFVAVGVLAYHIRFQLVLLPVAGLVALVPAALAKRVQKDQVFAALLAAFAVFALIWQTNRALEQTLPVREGEEELPNTFLARSIQCRLRCDVSLFEKDCMTPEGKRLITEAYCGDFFASLVDLGAARTQGRGMFGTLQYIGLVKVLRWLMLAPATYLEEKPEHLEYEEFAFNRNVRFLSVYVDPLDYFGRLFPPTRNAPSRAFEKVISYLKALYFEWRAFHVLAAVVVLASCGLLLLSRNLTTGYLAASCVGTFLVFSYVQPHAPLRYLVQIAVPGCMALWIVALEQKKRETE